MQQGKIIEIGQEAIDQEENILIFFGKGVTEGLRPYSIIQEIENPKEVELTVGDKILFDDQEYRITYLGKQASTNLQTMEHVSFVFSNVPTDKLVGSISLTPSVVPKITKNMTITYKG